MHKIIFAGPVGAGKTTAIKSISDIEPFLTEERATDETAQIKEKTTVAMDYGLLRLDQGEVVHLYGTPGQSRFRFMWDILTEGGIGLVIFVKATSTSAVEELNFYLDQFSAFIEKTGVAVGLTHSEAAPPNFIEKCSEELSQRGLKAPVFEVDPRKKLDVMILLEALFYSIEPSLS